MLRTVILLLALFAIAAGRRIPPAMNKKGLHSQQHHHWGMPVLDVAPALEEDLANDLDLEVKDDKTKTVKHVKNEQVKQVKRARLVTSPVPGPMPGPNLFGFYGLE